MKKILSFAAMLALVLPLFVSNAQEKPAGAKDKECVSKTEKSGCCGHASKAATSSSSQKATLTKTSAKTTGCSGKSKEGCAGKCSHAAKTTKTSTTSGGNN